VSDRPTLLAPVDSHGASLEILPGLIFHSLAGRKQQLCSFHLPWSFTHGLSQHFSPLLPHSSGRWALRRGQPPLQAPVGFNTRDQIDYSKYPILVEISGIGPATAARISFDGSSDQGRIYLYNDGCVPTHSDANMTAYLNRLKQLAKKTVK